MLRPANLNIEPLHAGARLRVGTNAPANEALRPGRGKLTFEKITAAWQSDPAWNHVLEFEDYFFVEGNAVTQSVVRTITSARHCFFRGRSGKVSGRHSSDSIQAEHTDLSSRRGAKRSSGTGNFGERRRDQARDVGVDQWN